MWQLHVDVICKVHMHRKRVLQLKKYADMLCSDLFSGSIDACGCVMCERGFEISEVFVRQL